MNDVILITGASSGIGLQAAQFFHTKGYNVIGLSRTKPENCEFTYITCDLTKTEDISEAIKKIPYEHIDVLINCAGVGTGGAVEMVPEQDLKWVFDVNLFGLIEFTKQSLSLLKKSNSGKIINVGSMAGEITIPYQLSYSMSKSALHRFTEGLRIELRPFGIQATTIMPGDTKTDFTANRKTINPPGNPYEDVVHKSISKMEKDEQQGVPSQKVVNVISKMIKKKRLPVFRIVGFDYKVLYLLSRILPARLVERIVTKMYS